MPRRLQDLTLNQRLAVDAFGLGALAALANPLPGPVVAVDTREMALMVQREADHVTPQELAAWIVEGRADYRLVDLRSAKEFAELPKLSASAVSAPPPVATAGGAPAPRRKKKEGC